MVLQLGSAASMRLGPLHPPAVQPRLDVLVPKDLSLPPRTPGRLCCPWPWHMAMSGLADPAWTTAFLADGSSRARRSD